MKEFFQESDAPSTVPALFQRRKSKLITGLQRQIKKTLESIEKCSLELKNAQGWENVQHEGMLLQANLYRLRLGMHEVAVADWKAEEIERIIKLDPLVEPLKQAEQHFRKSKKLRAAIPHLEGLAERRKLHADKLETELRLIEAVETSEELETLEKRYLRQPPPKKADVALKKALPYWEFTSEAGLKIRVGKSAKDNDRLTFRYGRGSDLWLHVRDWPGSHVVLCIPKNGEPDQESLQDAMQLALHYSKAKEETTAEISVTQCKYVTRYGKGQPGKVQLSLHKAIMIKKDPGRLIRLRGGLRI